MAFGAKKDTTSAEVKSIELSLKQVEESKKNMIYQLGELYYESNKDNESIDEIYKEKVDTIKKLEYNCKVWNNRKLKTQGLRMCENCGNTLPYDSSFCNKCGYKLQAVSEELVII
ncbi:MAG: hypothetical protein II399_06405 [Lachnospiraceae bacterium]|jgi:ribosomal protein L40E|nr:hypothetical protein [Lachnospiraceae bacterium]